MFDFLNTTAGLALTLLGIATVLGGFYFKRARPWLVQRESDRIAQRDALIGRPPVLDSITHKEISPALPGIGQRMNTIETAVAELVRSNQRHEAHEAHLGMHDREIAELKEGAAELKQASVERIVTRQESANAWRAMEAATNAQPDQESDPLPE